MKKLIVIAVILIYSQSFSQNDYNIVNTELGKAILVNNKLFVGGVVEGRSEEKEWNHLISYFPYVKKFSLLKDEHAAVTIQSVEAYVININETNYDFPFCWDVVDTLWYTMLSRSGRNAFSFKIYRDKLEKPKDAIVYNGYDENKFSKKNPELFKNTDVYSSYHISEYQNNFRHVNPVETIYSSQYLKKEEEYLIKTSFNFLPLSQDSFIFFIRAKNYFTSWSFRYPEPKIKSDQNNWNEEKTFVADSVILKVPKELTRVKLINNYFFPSHEKSLYNSINDTLFFDGNFDVVRFNKNVYVINSKYGNIYFLNDKKIEKVGQINLNDYWILNDKKLFIEDRDNNQIIFFAPVNWIRDDLPKPNVRIITDEKEFNKMFKYVLE